MLHNIDRHFGGLSRADSVTGNDKRAGGHRVPFHRSTLLSGTAPVVDTAFCLFVCGPFEFNIVIEVVNGSRKSYRGFKIIHRKDKSGGSNHLTVWKSSRFYSLRKENREGREKKRASKKQFRKRMRHYFFIIL